MKYHFKVYKESKGYFAQCLELDGCRTQGDNQAELLANAHEALNLYLDEPQDSKIVFPLPKNHTKRSDVIEVIVEPNIAFAFLMRRMRMKLGLTQHQMKELLDFKTLFAYQKLEKSKYANPTLKSLKHIKEKIPNFPIAMLF